MVSEMETQTKPGACCSFLLSINNWGKLFSGNNLSAFKYRWSSLSKPHNKNGNDIKPHRKNSNPMSNFNFAAMQQVG